MIQTPYPGTKILTYCGDTITFRLRVTDGRRGRGVLRTSIGGAKIRRREIVEAYDEKRPFLYKDWSDIPMAEVAPGTFEVRLPLVHTGVFYAKTCFLPEDSARTEWPDGGDVAVKTAPAWTCRGISVYTAFTRQFLPGSAGQKESPIEDRVRSCGVRSLDDGGWTVIPPSGTFRDLIRHLDEILVEERFGILQLLPIHPVPVTYARMGRFGSPFACTDFMAVDPALAEFDCSATPLAQFGELVNAVHARGARIFLDIPANHTGWASALQTHHPEWFRRGADGKFVSPGAWGVTWEDLVELDYANRGLRKFMADVFEFWCMQGADGFRCDAGYKVPADVWKYVSARVRRKYPDTVFMLEGLGGEISVTESLISESGLDWAYSEIFQTEDRTAFEKFLPNAMRISEETGPLVNFAETHDNNRLAARSPRYAVMRTALAALTAHQGCFGITNGVEWFATEKIDVHGVSALNWGARENQKAFIGRINAILAVVPAFGPGAGVRMIQRGGGNSLAVLRCPAVSGDIIFPRARVGNRKVLVLVNLDPDSAQEVSWPESEFPGGTWDHDLLGGESHLPPARKADGLRRILLNPGQVLCIPQDPRDSELLEQELDFPNTLKTNAVRKQTLRAMVLRIRDGIMPNTPLEPDADIDAMAEVFASDPTAFFESLGNSGTVAAARFLECSWPVDVKRRIMLPPGFFLLVRAVCPFCCRVDRADGDVIANLRSVELDSGEHCVVLSPFEAPEETAESAVMSMDVSAPDGLRRDRMELFLLPVKTPRVRRTFTGAEVRAGNMVALLSNDIGAMSRVNALWSEIRSQYDAILAANPDPNAPHDRIVLFTRCRIWMVNRGFSTEVDGSCLESFSCEAGSGSASWLFKVPVGTGKSVILELKLELERGENTVRMDLYRRTADDNPELLADANEIQVIFRPDIEKRISHFKTKAFTGPENLWPKRISQVSGGFIFRPDDGVGLVMRISNGDFIPESEWHYMIGHSIDAERGQDGSSDLYSPGWFTADIGGGTGVRLEASACSPSYVPDALPRAPEAQPHPAESAGIAEALRCALRDFIVRRDGMSTVIAGYPWFLDWGRDTFIVLRGMIAAGMTGRALDIIRKFGEFESDGMLPNMICGSDASNRDTSDAPLWYVIACGDLAKRIGGKKIYGADCGGRTVRDVVLDIARGYLDGVPNGVAVDSDSGLVFSPSHFTWMDTNYPAGTPRQGYPVEIQALWIAALGIVARLDPSGGWTAIRKRAAQSLERLFWDSGRGFLSDCLHSGGFIPAASAEPDDHLRCNQLFAVTLGAVKNLEISRGVVRSSAKLLVPGGIRTLAPGKVSYGLPLFGADGRALNDPSNPYWGRYEGDEDTRRKPAYHNGTAWMWPYPSFAEALLLVFGKSAQDTAAAIIGACAPWLESGCVGHLPEIMDGDAPHTGRGCDAQAWSVSEFLRLAIKLGLR